LRRRDRTRFRRSGFIPSKIRSGSPGGLNLYGFAGGDPVNFNDPFGLSADTVRFEGEQARQFWIRARSILGAGAANGNKSAETAYNFMWDLETSADNVLVRIGDCEGGRGCYNKDLNRITIDVEEINANPAVAFAPVVTAHEVGHAYSDLRFGGFKSTFAAYDFENAARLTLGFCKVGPGVMSGTRDNVPIPLRPPC